MPDFITFQELRNITTQKSLSESTILHRASTKQGKNTFLSHSSKDKAYLPPVITILEGHGAGVYVDDGDVRLPSTPSKETAAILRETIKSLNRFVVFVTPNSKDSRWIPWELGLGDAFKNAANVALFPASETSYTQQWANQEYLGLYRRIVWGRIESNEPCWIVWDQIENTAETLSKWIRGY